MKSIRRELSIRLLAGACILLVAGGGILSLFIHARLIAEFDRALEAQARALAALTSREGRYLEIDYHSDQMPAFADKEDPEYFVFEYGGRVIARSESPAGRELDAGRGLPARVGEPEFDDIRLPDGRNGRLVRLAIHPRSDESEAVFEEEEEGQADEAAAVLPAARQAGLAPVVITVARSRSGLDALLWSLYGTLGAIAVLALLGVVLLVRHAIGRGLRPLAVINRQISDIGPDALGRRIEVRAPPKELRPILGTINDLLGRLHRAFERERRFSSNVAHELRTPVAELRAACDVGGRWPEDSANARRLFADIHEIAIQMETIVTHLLMLSRCENGAETVRRAAVCLQPVVDTCWERSARQAAARGLRLESRVDPLGTVRTDGEKLGMIVQNLIDNAVAHGAPDSVVQCFTANGGTGLDLVIANRVKGITRDDLAHVFEPFWRKDAARSASNHAGLGLSIVRTLCDMLGIGLGIDLTADRTFQVRLSFAGEPAAQPRAV
ncbi:MAG: ATP-binding protein [Opitutaceae bacterium]